MKNYIEASIVSEVENTDAYYTTDASKTNEEYDNINI